MNNENITLSELSGHYALLCGTFPPIRKHFDCTSMSVVLRSPWLPTDAQLTDNWPHGGAKRPSSPSDDVTESHVRSCASNVKCVEEKGSSTRARARASPPLLPPPLSSYWDATPPSCLRSLADGAPDGALDNFAGRSGGIEAAAARRRRR